MNTLTPDLLRRAYSQGIFPMAESANSRELHWVEPKRRGLIPIGKFHISRSLRRRLRRADYRITLNQDFDGVIVGCAQRPNTWINQEIRSAFNALHREGDAHSLEVWRDDRLIGGVYGVALGAAFFAESMFSRETDASKIALAYLLDHLERCGFRLFDTQYASPHLTSLGGREVSRLVYRALLDDALREVADFGAVAIPSPQELVQRNTQTSMRG